MSLFKQIKSTNLKKNKSLISFKDNASVIEGTKEPNLITLLNTKNIYQRNSKINFTYKAETHNFPTEFVLFRCRNWCRWKN